MTIASVQADHYRIPLPVPLSDSTRHHGGVRADHGARPRCGWRRGLGYTYTVGAGGGAIRDLIARDLGPPLAGADETRIEALWQRLWWQVHYVGRGGLAVHAISAIDTALWDLMAKRRGLPLWRLLGGHDPHVPAYAGGIDLQFPLERLLRQTEHNLEGLSRDQDEGRPRPARRRRGPGAGDARAARAGCPADGRCQHALERRSGDPGGAGIAAHDVYWLEEPTIPDDVAGHARIVREGGLPVAAGENLHSLYEFHALIAAGGVTFPSRICPTAAASRSG